MSELIFMPWYAITQEEKIGKYSLRPFSLSNTSNKNGDSDIINILNKYITRPIVPSEGNHREPTIKQATIITHEQNADPIELEALQYTASFCGISERTFSNDLYLCSDNLRIVIQRYQHPVAVGFTPLVGTRTKTGFRRQGFSSGLFREVRPWHISDQPSSRNPNYQLKFEGDLARSLWGFYKGKGVKRKTWDNKIFPALHSYHRANADQESEQLECIYSQSAIERLLLGSGHSENALVAAFVKLQNDNKIAFRKPGRTTRNWKSVTYQKDNKDEPPASISEAWLRELTRVRNCFAHGNHAYQKPLVWSVQEHLLLAAFILPLLVKSLISSHEPTYKASDFDTAKLDHVEIFLAATDYFKEPHDESGVTPWAKLIQDCRFA